MKLTLVSVLILLTFSACSCKTETIEKLVYIESECAEIPVLDYNSTTVYKNHNITYSIIQSENGELNATLGAKPFLKLVNDVQYLKKECKKKDKVIDRFQNAINEHNEYVRDKADED